MRTAGHWTTKEGVRLQVIWMDSVHLAHSVNMLLKRAAMNAVAGSGVYKEAIARGMIGKYHDGTPLDIPKRREMPDEMCMLNAILGVRPDCLGVWKANPHWFAARCPVADPELWAEFVKLKLTR